MNQILAPLRGVKRNQKFACPFIGYRGSFRKKISSEKGREGTRGREG